MVNKIIRPGSVIIQYTPKLRICYKVITADDNYITILFEDVEGKSDGHPMSIMYFVSCNRSAVDLVQMEVRTELTRRVRNFYPVLDLRLNFVW